MSVKIVDIETNTAARIVICISGSLNGASKNLKESLGLSPSSTRYTPQKIITTNAIPNEVYSNPAKKLENKTVKIGADAIIGFTFDAGIFSSARKEKIL